MITAYFGAPVRGVNGDRATVEEMDANISKALQIACWLRTKFPQVNWTIPHEHEEIIQELYLDGVPATQIIRCWSRVAVRKDFAVFYDGGGYSKGMEYEEDAMSRAGKPVVHIDEAGEEAENDIQEALLILAEIALKKHEAELAGDE